MTRRLLPWSASCFVCGDKNPRGLNVRFQVEGDRVVVETEVDPQYEGYPGHLHGGVVTALLDETAGWACCLATSHLYVTAELKVRFRAPVPGIRPITVTGEFLETRARFARGRAEITDSNGRVLASAEGTYVRIPEAAEERIIHHLKMPDRPARREDIQLHPTPPEEAAPREPEEITEPGGEPPEEAPA